MDNKTKSADTSVRAAFALMQGVLLAMAIPLLYMMVPEFFRSYPLVVLLGLLPLLSFGTSSLINVFLQLLSCGSVGATTILTAGSLSPAAVAVAGLLVHWLPFVRKPVTDLVAELPPGATEDQVFARELWGYSFYIFWAGVYAQTFASGMLAKCP